MIKRKMKREIKSTRSQLLLQVVTLSFGMNDSALNSEQHTREESIRPFLRYQVLDQALSVETSSQQQEVMTSKISKIQTIMDEIKNMY